MWCTQCHTAFSWATGAIETNIHNPHYHEWLRNRGARGRTIGEVQCGREIDVPFVLDMRRLFNKFKTPHLHVVLDDLQLIRINIMGEFQRLGFRDYAPKREELREKFIKQKLTEKSFKKQMLNVVDIAEYMQERLQIYNTFIQSATDIMYRLFYDLRDLPTNTNYDHLIHRVKIRVIDYKTELNALIVYTQTCLHELASAFKEPFVGLI
jgi:hypothetical protein